jgi:hypothetical protein
MILFIKLVSIKRKLNEFKLKKQGQILPIHDIGKWIEFLSSLSETSTIVEIGTWNGRGSSQAIIRGVQKRNLTSRGSVQVLGFEINKSMFNEANKILHSIDFFEVVFGRLVGIEDLDIVNLSEVEIDWLAQDIEMLNNSPLAINKLPDTIDLLILDGGEFSTYAEFLLLKDRTTQWIVLDDTKVRKCKQILKEIDESSDFELIYQSSERNGTAILRRIPSTSQRNKLSQC